MNTFIFLCSGRATLPTSDTTSEEESRDGSTAVLAAASLEGEDTDTLVLGRQPVEAGLGQAEV